MRYQYPNTIWRFDLQGNNLSKTQAGLNKVIQFGRGYPDFFLCEARGGFHGLFIEGKKEGTRLVKKNGEWTSPHIAEQALMIDKLIQRGYQAQFVVGLDEFIEAIKWYKNLK